MIDIERVVEIGKKHSPESLIVVDNTFATPIFQRPAKYGVDVIVHSGTKYLAGHSEDLYSDFKFLQNAAGAIPGPFDCFLTLRGIRTLHLRMRAHDENAKEVYYPGFGGMLSVRFSLGKMR